MVVIDLLEIQTCPGAGVCNDLCDFVCHEGFFVRLGHVMS